MAMNPRLLRPRQSGFTPKSIPGLALWLDASDASTLFQDAAATTPATATNDPVGAWLDKSGNARHATQGTAASRPTVGSSSKAGKNAVRNNGTGSVALQVAAWPYTAGNTQFAVFNASTINQGIYQRGSLNDEPRMAIQTGANGVASVRATRGGSLLAQTHSEVGYALSQWSIGGTLFNTALGRAYRDGVYGADTTDSQTFTGDQELRLLSLPGNIYGINGGIAEFLYYDRQLTASEVTRVARYLAARWGITLAPTVSNADAQDWVNRVYANGGTVSATTATAVNTFCDSIDAAGIRDRFYRLNLFAGNSDASLNAVRTPLYRGSSLGGTQFGGATDTNVNFVQGDYAETGASGGLTGNGSTKYLETGFSLASLPSAASRHISVYEIVKSANTNDASIGGTHSSSSDGMVLHTKSPATAYAWSRGGPSEAVAAAGSYSGGAHWIGQNTTLRAAQLYKNGSLDNSATLANDVTSTAANAVGVFAWKITGGTPDPTWVYHSAARLGGYSIGVSMSNAQASAYYTALQAFQTALGRQV